MIEQARTWKQSYSIFHFTKPFWKCYTAKKNFTKVLKSVDLFVDVKVP